MARDNDNNRNQPPLLRREDISVMLRKSAPKFRRITEKDQHFALNASSEAQFALQRCLADSRLLECDPITIRDAYENCAMVGLSLNPVLQYAAILPVWNKDKGMHDCALWPMYRGFIKLATDTGLITSVEVENVYDADKFSIRKKTDRTEIEHEISHKTPRNTDDNRYHGTYVITRLVNDSDRPLVEWVPAEDVVKAMESSKNYKPNDPNSVWVKWVDEMRRKMAIKRAQKYWPKSDGRLAERLAHAVSIDNQIDAGEQPRSREQPLAPEVKKVSEEQVKQLTELSKKAGINPERICTIYFVDKLDDIPQKLFSEVKERIEKAAKVKSERQLGNKGDDQSNT